MARYAPHIHVLALYSGNWLTTIPGHTEVYFMLKSTKYYIVPNIAYTVGLQKLLSLNDFVLTSGSVMITEANLTWGGHQPQTYYSKHHGHSQLLSVCSQTLPLIPPILSCSSSKSSKLKHKYSTSQNSSSGW